MLLANVVFLHCLRLTLINRDCDSNKRQIGAYQIEWTRITMCHVRATRENLRDSPSRCVIYTSTSRQSTVWKGLKVDTREKRWIYEWRRRRDTMQEEGKYVRLWMNELKHRREREREREREKISKRRNIYI